MASIQAFISTLEEFINELVETFPKDKKLKVYKNSFEQLKKVNPRKILEGFMNEIGPHQAKIMAKDENYFLNTDIEFLNKMNIKKWWTPTLNSQTKDAIWQYLNTLLIIGTTISAIPPQMLSALENVAEQCASQMTESGGIGGIEQLANPEMLSNMQRMLGSMMEKKDDNI